MTRAVPTRQAERTAWCVLLCNVLAQTCCNYSVLTRDQRAHAVEETIWLLSGAAVALEVTRSPEVLDIGANKFKRGVRWCCPPYIMFMALVDVPMYVHRAREDMQLGTTFSTFRWCILFVEFQYFSVYNGIEIVNVFPQEDTPPREGLTEVASCAIVTQTTEYWVQEMPWMSGYFSFAVWIAVWLCNNPINAHTEYNAKLKNVMGSEANQAEAAPVHSADKSDDNTAATGLRVRRSKRLAANRQ